MIFITISGCPASGKSTLAKHIKYMFDFVELISSDDYFFDKDNLPELKDEYKIKQPDSLKLITHHYELYESVNWDLLIKDLENILNTSNKKVLILEGFLILKNPWIKERANHSFFLDIPNFTDNLKLLERYWKRKWIGFSCSFKEKGITFEETMWKWNISFNSFLKNYPNLYNDKITVLNCFQSTEELAIIVCYYLHQYK